MHLYIPVLFNPSCRHSIWNLILEEDEWYFVAAATTGHFLMVARILAFCAASF